MRNIRVLLITNSTTAHQNLAHYLRAEAKFEVNGFASGREALHHLEQVAPDHYTVVLLDFGLDSEPNGDQLLKTVRTSFPWLPVIVFTGQEPEKGIRNLQKGAYRYLSPPLNHIEITKIIRDLTDPQKIREELLNTLDAQQYAKQESEALGKISAAISSEIKLEEVAGTILDELRRFIEYRTASIQLIQNGNRSLIAGRGFEGQLVDMRLVRPISKDPLVKHIVDTQEAMILPTVTAEPRWEKSHAKEVKSWVGAPLNFKGETIGLLTLDHDREGYYTESVKGILGPFCSQAAMALQNARRIQDLEIVSKVADVIGDKFKVADLLDTLANQIAHQLDCTHCSIFLSHKESNETWLVLATAHGPFKEKVKNKRFKPDFGVAGWVYRHGQSVVLPDARKDKRFRVGTVAPKGPRSMLVAPIKVGGRTIGVISADQDRFSWFSENDRRLVDTMAQQVGIAIQRVTALEVLQGISNQILTKPDMRQLLERIVTEALKLTYTSSGVIYLISEDGKSITRQFSPPGFAHPAPRLSNKRGITYQVIKNGKMKVFPNIRRSKQVNPVLHESFRSMIAVPLKFGEKVTGVLYLNDEVPHNFTATELSLLATLADQAAIAVQNAQLFDEIERRANDLSVINEVIKAISTESNQKELLNKIAMQVAQKLNSDQCALFIWSHQQNKLVPEVAVGLEMKQNFGSGEGVAGWVYQHGQAALIADTSQDKRYLYFSKTDEQTRRSMVVVPIKVGDKVIGVISVDKDQPGWFNNNHQQLLETLMSQAGYAIQQAKGLEVFEEIAGLTTSQQKIRTVLARIVQRAVELLSVSSGVIHLIHEDGQHLEDSVPYPSDFPHPTSRFEKQEGLTYKIYQNGERVIVDKAHLDSSVNRARGVVIKSIIGIPLKYEGKVTGVLFLNDNDPHQYSDAELSLLSTLADQAAIAIKNAKLLDRLNQERAQRLNTIKEIGLEISAGRSLSDFIASLLEKTRRLMHQAYAAQIWELDEPTGKLKIVPDATYEQPQVKEISMGEGIIGTVANTCKPYLAKNILDQARRKLSEPYHDDTRSQLAVPLFKGDKLIGVLNVEHQQINAFDETDVDVLEAIAGQVAVAIESAASLIEIKELNNLLEQLQKITAEITSETTDHDKVLNQIVTSVGKTLRGVYCAVRLYDPSKQEFGKRFADGVMQEVDDRAPRKGGATNYVVKHKRALYAGTLADVVPESNEPIIRKELAQVGAQAAAYLPLNIKENTVGVLYMFWTTPQSFTGNEKRTLQLFADQTTIAIENARLFKERSQELARTQALSRLGEMLAVIEQQ